LEKQLEYAKTDFDEDAADDLSNQLMSSKELLERMSYLQETYPTTMTMTKMISIMIIKLLMRTKQKKKLKMIKRT
jgi:hypothetical protein